MTLNLKSATTKLSLEVAKPGAVADFLTRNGAKVDFENNSMNVRVDNPVAVQRELRKAGVI